MISTFVPITKFFQALLVASILLASHAHADIDLSQKLQAEKSEQTLKTNYAKALVLFVECNEKGEDTVQTLKHVFAFIERLEKDPDFRQCVVAEEELAKIGEIMQQATELLEAQQIERKSFDGLVSRLQLQKERLSTKIKSCKKEN